MHQNEVFDDKIVDALESIDFTKMSDDETTVAVKNLKTLSECRPPQPETDPDTQTVPETTWEKVKFSTAKVWDNETTRVLIKSGGALASVLVVAYSTIHKDHVIERQALAQANQRST